MGLASTFTNSIVREIGRNYGKSISNNLLGDSHSTPVRMVRGGQTDITRKRRRIYKNNLDEYLQKFSIFLCLFYLEILQKKYFISN
ncbi:MAG: hypothetical protein ACKVLJ_02480 [Cytophagales bacterium]